MPEITRDDGFVIHFEERGNPEAPPVVLLHGFTSDLRSWHQQFGVLGDDYRVIAMDLRGHGKTTAPEDPAEYTMAAHVTDVRSLLEALDVPLCALVGSSFGGMVAAQFAVESPERLAALVLSDTSAAYDDPRYAADYWNRERGIDRSCTTVAKFGTAALGKEVAAGIGDAFLREGIIRRYAALTAESYLGTARIRRERPNLLAVVHERITAPVLICAGDRDPVRSASEVLAAELPDARFVLFRNAGHTVPLHRPAAFSETVLRFLRNVEDGVAVAGHEES